MFTGIIEDIGIVKQLKKEKNNLDITIESRLTPDLKIDQSVSHNGVCLTVVDINETIYTVTAIEETLNKTNIGNLTVGDSLNLERAMVLGSRLDGHIVQGHVDQTAICTEVNETNGSWKFSFEYNFNFDNNLTIEKGSITINGVSLTVVNSQKNTFDVAIIPYTFEHTNFNHLKAGQLVNLEFDVIGKYVKRFKEFSS